MLSLHHLLSSLLGSSSTENWWKICCRDQTRKITQACFNQLATFADILSIAAIFVLRQGRGEQIIHTGCFLTVHRLQRIVHLVQSMLLSIFVYHIDPFIVFSCPGQLNNIPDICHFFYTGKISGE